MSPDRLRSVKAKPEAETVGWSSRSHTVTSPCCAGRGATRADADLLALIGASSADIRQQRKLHVGGDAGRE